MPVEEVTSCWFFAMSLHNVALHVSWVSDVDVDVMQYNLEMGIRKPYNGELHSCSMYSSTATGHSV